MKLDQRWSFLSGNIGIAMEEKHSQIFIGFNTKSRWIWLVIRTNKYVHQTNRRNQKSIRSFINRIDLCQRIFFWIKRKSQTSNAKEKKTTSLWAFPPQMSQIKYKDKNYNIVFPAFPYVFCVSSMIQKSQKRLSNFETSSDRWITKRMNDFLYSFSVKTFLLKTRSKRRQSSSKSCFTEEKSEWHFKVKFSRWFFLKNLLECF